MFTALTLTLLPLAGAAEPTPITSTMVEIVIADPSSAAMCDAYRDLMNYVAEVDPGEPIWAEVADAYAIILIEGTEMRLDNAARATLTDWLHTDCS